VVLIARTTLTLIFPNLTTTVGPTFSPAQLIFAAVVSLILCGSLLFVQTVRHREDFLPAGGGLEGKHAPPPSNKGTRLSAAVLFVSLVSVAALAKARTPSTEFGIETAGAPKAVVEIIIAGLVLVSECLACFRAARANRLQASMNLALGLVLASVGMTIPAVAAVSVRMGRSLTLGISPKDGVRLALTLLVSVITLGTGGTTVLQGIVHS
jgi:Ca2+:H+ antiporter